MVNIGENDLKTWSDLITNAESRSIIKLKNNIRLRWMQ